MIIKTLLDIIYGLFSLLTAPINIPDLPSSIDVIMSEFMGYINVGLGILAAYTDLKYLLVLFSIIISVDVGLMLYKIVMWIIKKIPMLNVK